MSGPIAVRKTYLVTGGLGFLGSQLVRALVHEGHRVRVLDNGFRGSLNRLGDVRTDVEVLHGDIRNPQMVQQAVSGTDCVCHLAAINGTRYFYEQPSHVLDVGIKGIVNVLESCIQERVRELLLVSSSEVYQTPPLIPTDESAPLSIPDPSNPRYSYGGTKIISELMAIHCSQAYFKRVLIVRPHNVFGPNMGWDHVIPQFVVRLLQTKSSHCQEEIPFPIQGTGEQSRAFIYIDDCVDGLMRVLEHGEHRAIYHIGTTEEIRIRVVAERIAAYLGVRIRIVPGPEAHGGALRRCPDIGKLRGLGFQPRFSFDEGLRLTIDWYAAHPRVEECNAVSAHECI